MISTGQTDCLPFVTEKFVILPRFTRIMTQCKNASPHKIHVSSRNKCFVQKNVFQGLRSFCERSMIQKHKMSDD